MGSIKNLSSAVFNKTGLPEYMVSGYRACFENSRDAMNIFSLNKKILDVNKSLVLLSGYSKEELLSMQLNDLYPESGSRESQKRIALLKEKKQIPLFETTLLTKNNRQIPVEIAVTFLDDWKNGELVCQGNIRDISGSKRVLTKLKKSEEKFRSLIENLDAGIARSTPGPLGKYIEVNQAMVDLLGYSKEELFKTNLFGFLENPQTPEALFTELQAKTSVREKEISLVRKDKNVIQVSYTAKAIRNSRDEILYIDEILVDITARRQVEEEIQKNEKLKSIGDLAGGIAHHFNNIMTGLFGNISLAKTALTRDCEAMAYLNNAEACMQEGIALTKQLLTFAKGGDPIMKPVNIADIVNDAANFSLSGSNTRLTITTGDDLWAIRADKAQISQVISNIVMNARQAMTRSGELSISIKNSNVLKDNLLTIARDRYLKISITDNGSGMHQKDLERIFDPYFTTREGGSGMGLSICYSIIKKHEGHIFVSSQVGAGTTITIYLPAIAAVTKKETSMTQEKSNTSCENQKRILVMDDEDHIRLLLKKMLEKFGYHVDLAKDGEDAVRTYKTMSEQNCAPHLVIMDLTIPGGMGGKEASKAILEFDPDAGIVTSSGYSTDPVMANFTDFGLKGIIPKPYRMEELKNAIDNFFSGKEI